MSAPRLAPGFELEGITVRLDQLLPTRATSENMKESSKFRALTASIREVGIIEPLSVFPQKGGKYLLLDGHARAEALRELGISDAPCLVSLANEGYTFNKRVNRIAPIQANRMILKALDAGVPEERIARALNLAVETVRMNRSLLFTICPEAVGLLQDKQVALKTLALLKKVKPLRQIEMAEIMVAAGNYSVTYARALVILDRGQAELVVGSKAMPGANDRRPAFRRGPRRPPHRHRRLPSLRLSLHLCTRAARPGRRYHHPAPGMDPPRTRRHPLPPVVA